MNLKPIEQICLYEHNDNINFLKKLNEKEKLPNKIIFSGQKGIGKSTLAFHFINFLFSKKEDHPYDIVNCKINENNKSFKFVKENCHPNFFLISLSEKKKNIEISQIREMISFCNKSSFNNESKIILIDNAEYMNVNSVNAILKIIEEPNDNIIFILILDSNKKLLETLKSRCINFNFRINTDQKKKILGNLLTLDFFNKINNDFKDYFLSPGDYIYLHNYFIDNKIDFNSTIEDFLKTSFKNKSYKNNSYFKNNLSLFIELYFKKNFLRFNSKIKDFSNYKYFLDQINKANKYNLDIESVILELEFKLNNG